jgi:F0F1-type ATP synthase delta subunit
MASGSLARRYAKAIIELGNTEKIASDLRALAQAMKTSAELQTALTNPAIRRGDRRQKRHLCASFASGG